MTLQERCPPCIRELDSCPLFELSTTTTYVGKCFKVYDGDTCRFMIELFGQPYAFKARMLHVNTPEMRTKCVYEKKIAVLAKHRAKQLLDQVIVKIRVTGTDLYGRKLVEFQFDDGRYYHDIILQEKLALPYEGVQKFSGITVHEGSEICTTCNTTEKAKKNCLMWRSLTNERQQ